MVEQNKVLLEKVDTLENVADSLTKSVSTQKFSWRRENMGILPETVKVIKGLLYEKKTTRRV